MENRGLVLVTGGSGYVAGFCIAQLLREGWQVRATVRSLSRADDVRKTVSTPVDPQDRLSFVAADLGVDAGWTEAMAGGCTYVLHVASPLPSTKPRSDDELVVPARDGTLRVLAAARAAGVRRVVMTASTAAIAYGHGGRSTPFTEEDWSDETNTADTSAYERSKTIAERAAWAWVREKGGIELVTINPGAILGPVLGKDYSASIDIVKKLMDGSLPGTPRFGWPLVDVRDIADLHCRAMVHPQAAGQRFIGAGPFYWMNDIARTLKARVPELARRVPTRRLPDWLLYLLSPFDPVVRERLFELGKERPVSSEKARILLGWSPRSNDDAIVATAESLAALKLV